MPRLGIVRSSEPMAFRSELLGRQTLATRQSTSRPPSGAVCAPPHRTALAGNPFCRSSASQSRATNSLNCESFNCSNSSLRISNISGCVATFKKRPESDGSSRPGSVSCSHLEQLVDELNLLPDIRTVHPPRLPLPDHVHGLVSLDRSPRHVEFTKALLGLHS